MSTSDFEVQALSEPQDLPDGVSPGTFGFTFLAALPGFDDPQEQGISFEWDGDRTARWSLDPTPDETDSPVSSELFYGWASWLNGQDLLLAFAGGDAPAEGWARVPGGAPTVGWNGVEADDEDQLSEASRWLRLARLITSVLYQRDLPGMNGDRYEI